MRETLRLSLCVVYRHWCVYKKDFFANISPTLADPLFFIFALGLGLGGYVEEIQGLSYMTYLAPGLAATAGLITSFFETSYNVYVRHTYEGIYRAMLATPIGPKEIIFGELLWVAIKAAVMTAIVSFVFFCFGLVKGDLLLFVPLVGAFIGLGCGAIGLIATCLVRNINQFQTVYAFIISPMFFVSGAFFPIDDAPAWVQAITWLSPLFHGVVLTQHLLWNRDLVLGFMYHLPALVGLSCILSWIAYKKFYRLLYA